MALQLARCIHFNSSTPGIVEANAPVKGNKVRSVRRARGIRGFDYRLWTDGSVVPDVSSGGGALVCPKVGQREKVVLVAGSLACSYRAECVAMEVGLKRLVDAIWRSNAHRTRVVPFEGSLLLRMALGNGPAVVGRAVVKRICALILHIVRLRVPNNFQFVFSYFGGPRNEAADKAVVQENEITELHGAWAPGIVAGGEGQVRNEMRRAFEAGRMSRAHRSVLLDCVRPGPKHSKLDRLNASLAARFGTVTSKHFGWL
ncbi:hypothetical protein TRVL_08979 [Trypanosoma vivax]|nr:hypothetical protein TRVL_08979 [Trypanosoma vivax]